MRRRVRICRTCCRRIRRFAPSDAFAKQANATEPMYDSAATDRLPSGKSKLDVFSGRSRGARYLDWSEAPFARWFVGGTLNVAVNCVDRHVDAGLGDRVAIHFEGEPGDTRTVTYAELQAQVAQAANALTELGIKAGDRVAIYLPMIPEAAVAMLACARVGAPHSVVFGGFSAEALRSRIEDAQAKLVITSDGGYRRGKPMALKPAVDEAVDASPSIEKVLVVQRTKQDVAWNTDRDVWWHDLVGKHRQLTGPKHSTANTRSSSSTRPAQPVGRRAFCTPRWLPLRRSRPHTTTCSTSSADADVYWCTADVGWVTGHSYIVYGPMANGATQVMYEGTPDTPHKGRWWEIVEKYRVSLLYTAPTAIRTFMKWGDDLPAGFDMSSLRLLGSVGEPINPEAWMWYREHIGGNECPVVDTWWQTETGAIMISPLPGVTAAKPGSAMRPLPGIGADVLNTSATPVPNGSGGYLVLTDPWPSMLRGIWGDPERYQETYWSRFPGMYFAGDGSEEGRTTATCGYSDASTTS